VEYHKEQLKALQDSYDELQARIDAMYLDKLGGKITEKFWENMNGESRAEQPKIQDRILDHQNSDLRYKEHGNAILKLSRMAYSRYLKQNQVEKRRLLNILLLKSSLKDGIVMAVLRKPFDMLRDMSLSEELKKAPETTDSGALEKWWGIRYYYRTFLADIPEELIAQIQVLAA
jgi:site-specific DNA recombinase